MLPENGWNVMGAGILVGSSYDFIEKIFDAPVWPSKKSTSYYLSKYAKNVTAMLPPFEKNAAENLLGME